jgi:RNA ligase
MNNTFDIQSKITEFQIPVVDIHDPVSNPSIFLASIKAIEGSEGVVVVWPDGHRCKSKSDWYVLRHRAKDNILREKNVIEMLISETVDDVKPFLLADDLKRLEDYETAFWQGIAKCAEVWKHQFLMVKMEHGNDRKGFALDTRYQDLDHNLKSAIFRYWDMVADANWRQAVIDVVAKNLATQPRVDSVRELFGNAKWNYGAVIEDQ